VLFRSGRVLGKRPPFERAHPLYALVETLGSDEDAAQAAMERFLEACLGDGTVSDAVVAQSTEQAKGLWAFREAISELVAVLAPAVNFDVSVALPQMGAPPMAPPQMGGPQMGGPPPGMPPGGPQPPMAGPAPVTGMRPQMSGPPPMMGGPQPAAMPGGAPMQLPAGGGPPPPPQGQPPGPMGPPPGPGAQFRAPMSWEDITRAVVQANPGARQEVIAAAVSKAMPLMTMDSQQQWRIIQAQLMQERIQQQGELGRGRIETTQRGQDIASGDRRMVEEGRGQRFTEGEQGKTDRLMATLDERDRLAQENQQLKRDLERMRQTGQGERLDTQEAGRDRRLGVQEQGRGERLETQEAGRAGRLDTQEAARNWSAELSADTRKAIQQLSVTARKELSAKVEAGRDRRAELSDSTKREIASMNAANKKELTEYLEAGRTERAGAAEAGRTQRFEEGEAGKASRLDTTEAGRTARAGAAEAGRDRRANWSADTRQAIASMTDATKRELFGEAEAGRTSRAGLSASARAEIAKLNATTRRELTEYLEGGRTERAEQARTSREGEGAANRAQRSELAGVREQRLDKGLDLRQQQLKERMREFDTRTQEKAAELSRKVDQDQQKAMAAQTKRDDKSRDTAITEWDKSQRAYDAYMRNVISAATNLSGPEKKKRLEELDAEFKRFLNTKEELSKQGGGSSVSDRIGAAGTGMGGPAAATRQRARSADGREVEWDGTAWVPVK
jgi:hypothetical protein